MTQTLEWKSSHTDVKTETGSGELRLEYKPRNLRDGWLPPGARREAWTRFILSVPRRNQTCWHLDFGLWPPEPERGKFLSF